MTKTEMKRTKEEGNTQKESEIKRMSNTEKETKQVLIRFFTSSNLRPTTTTLIGHFCLFRASLLGRLSEETEVKGQTKRKLLCPPEEPLTFFSMDSAAVRHNLCLPSSRISIDLETPYESTPIHPLNVSFSPRWSQNTSTLKTCLLSLFIPQKCSSDPPCSLHCQNEAFYLDKSNHAALKYLPAVSIWPQHYLKKIIIIYINVYKIPLKICLQDLYPELLNSTYTYNIKSH